MFDLNLSTDFTTLHVNVLLFLVKIVCDFSNFSVQCGWQGVTGRNTCPIRQVVVKLLRLIKHPTLGGNVWVHDFLELLCGDGGCCHFEGRVESGEVDLEPVLVPPIEHHGLEPMTPEDLMRQVGAARLELSITRLVRSLEDRDKLKLLLGEFRGGDVIEGGVPVNHVDDLQRPDEKDAALVAFIWGNVESLHLLCDLALKTDVALQQLERYLDSLMDLI